MRGEGSVFARGRYWHYVFWLDGEAHQGSTGVAVDSTAGGADEARARAVLARKREAARRGDEVPQEDRLALKGLRELLEENYLFKQNRSTPTMLASFKHLTGYFGEKTKATRIGAKIDRYVTSRRAEGAADGSIRIELALLNRAFKLAVVKKRLSPRSRPYIELPPEDPNAVREGFFRRAEVERLCEHLPPTIADVVLFLFFCPWRVGAARKLEWRDYSAADRALTLRRAANKTKRPQQIPVDPEHTPELMAILGRQQARRQPDCPFIFHGPMCGSSRVDQRGNPVVRSCLGSFRKVWAQACIAAGFMKPDPTNPAKAKAARTPHDLRRSGVKHYIDAGVDPHTVMLWSGHRTEAMLRRYHIVDLDDLRRAGKRASDYRGPAANVVPIGARAVAKGTTTEPLQELEMLRSPSSRS
ncbi:MAG TPA: tyrosine-type recombinase/integrase [Candidatus Binatia bacterium]|nr:tyrosine-type recombinase/integrase [Candidatus Binatia bacterium]